VSVRILIAHDNEIVRLGIAALLKSQPRWRARGVAKSVTEAIDRVAKLKPDLAILDLDLPDHGGLAAIPELLKVAPNLKILLFTILRPSSTNQGRSLFAMTAKHALEAGALGLVLKPDASDLMLALDSVSRGKHYFSTGVTEDLIAQLVQETSAPAISTSGLTEREVEVFKLLATGRTTKELAGELGISSKTIDAHRANIMHKLALHSQGDLLLYAIRSSLEQGESLRSLGKAVSESPEDAGDTQKRS